MYGKCLRDDANICTAPTILYQKILIEPETNASL